MGERKIDIKLLYPNLIIYLSPKKEQQLFKSLSNSFNESQYGPLYKQKGTSLNHDTGKEVSFCRIMQGDHVSPHKCLAEGEATLPCDAEQRAVEILYDMLLDSCYVIWTDPLYFTKNKVPPCSLNPDPSHRHIFRTVYLKQNSAGATFRFPVSGAVDYVENYQALRKYIETHTTSTQADLFIYNIVKTDRPMIKRICQTNGFAVAPLVGCSDMGMKAHWVLPTPAILQSLLEEGGKNIKYRLIGPRHTYGDNEKEIQNNSYNAGKIKCSNDGVNTPGTGPVESEDTTTEDGGIIVKPWIADHLVIMDYLTEWSERVTMREIIFQSVRDCPDTAEFIVEKTRNHVGMVTFEAMIDRNVVGRSRGFGVNKGKLEAVEKALQNLLKCCYYIEIKKSYCGSKRETPYFLTDPDSKQMTNIYRIASKLSGSPKKILHSFKKSWNEDLYFLQEYTGEERKKISRLAREMKFLIRWVGRSHYLCVYKQKKPNEILKVLLSIKSNENEKYKLYIPPSKVCQTEATTSSQNKNNEESDEAPSWVMKFIETAAPPPKKPKIKWGPLTNPERKKDDVYFRYKFNVPKPIPIPVHPLNLNAQEVHQNPDETVKTDTVVIDEEPDQKLSFSERLMKTLESSVQPNNETHASVKRTNDQEPGVEQGSECPEKNHKYSSHQQGFQYNRSFERINPSEEGETSNSFSGDLIGSSNENPKSWDSNVVKDESWSSTGGYSRSYNDSGFKEEHASPHGSYTSYETQNTFQHKNPYEGTRVKLENESNNLFFRPESNQHRNDHWDNSTKQQYDQRPNTSGGARNISSLFDFNGPQDYSRPPFPPRSPSLRKTWRPKGHSFSKLEKYGKNPRQSY